MTSLVLKHKNTQHSFFKWGFTLAVVASLQACIPVAVVGVVAGVAMVGIDRRTVGVQAVDQGMQLELESLLQRNMASTSQVNITIFNRKVLLTGQVLNEEEKERIEKLVKTNKNVKDVVNNTVIGKASTFAERSKDTYITSKVKTVLAAEKGVPTSAMRIFTEAGTVYLMGLVTDKEGQLAANAASSVSDVTQVVKVFDYISEGERDALEAKRNATPATKTD